MSIALYPGTFDPFTAGHLFIARRAASLFDRLVILVAVHPTKAPLFTTEERIEMIRQAVRRLPGVTVDATEGVVIDYAREVGATVLVRGLRGESDARYETELAQTNWSLAPEIATVFLPAPPILAGLSSTELKALARQGRDVTELCTPEIAARLRVRLAAGVSR